MTTELEPTVRQYLEALMEPVWVPVLQRKFVFCLSPEQARQSRGRFIEEAKDMGILNETLTEPNPSAVFLTTGHHLTFVVVPGKDNWPAVMFSDMLLREDAVVLE